MGDVVYLMVLGQYQGAISDGCGTNVSMGNRWQIGHEDEIFIFPLSNSITSTGRGSHLHGLQLCRLIDKSTPLFANAINNNEQLYMEFYFYRINRFGRWEKYYYIQLRGAFLSTIQRQFSDNNLDIEIITINYEYILCKHLTANTEFSYLALPEDYNCLFISCLKIPVDNGLKTLNNKEVGRPLAIGGTYNRSIDGFRETAERLGGDVPAGYEQVMDSKGLLTLDVSVAAGSTMGRMKFPELERLEQFGTRGIASGRIFDSELVGGPVESLTTDGVIVNSKGIATVEEHIPRLIHDPADDVTIGRLKDIGRGEMSPEQVDLNYYAHECREYQRYHNLGWEFGQPERDAGYNLWNHARTATLEDCRLKGTVDDLYHQDALNYDN